jgi:hypothetical protein
LKFLNFFFPTCLIIGGIVILFGITPPEKIMKKKTTMFLVSAAFGCLAFSQTAHAQADKRIRIIPPFPPFPPPRIEVRVPDVGPMQTREMSVITEVN